MSELDTDAKAIVAKAMKEGKVCLNFVWSASGSMKYHGPNMRTDQLMELLADAMDYFKGCAPTSGTLQ